MEQGLIGFAFDHVHGGATIDREDPCLVFQKSPPPNNKLVLLEQTTDEPIQLTLQRDQK